MTQRRPCGRFAPTPSGRMHLGNILCAMLSWLSARKQGGQYILRIEDLDAERCPRALADQIEDDLKWFGLDWDEGGSDGGDEWYQSCRFPLYRQYYDKLDEMGLLYPCFCSRAELHSAQAPHRSDGTYVYARTCRGLTAEQIAEKRKNRGAAMRLIVPDEEISFVDGCQGGYRENLERDCGDFIVRRSDGVYAYQLAVVVDDGLMGVTEVVRGQDLIGSTARQIYLHRLFGFEPPEFYHIPLLTAPDGRRLSKREKDLDLGVLREVFGRPEPVIGMLAHVCGLQQGTQPVAMHELIDRFSWDRIPKHDIALPEEILRKATR